MSTPQSNIYICSGVRLDNRYQHTIHFQTLAEQREFFAGKVVKTFSAYSYHRRKWKLKVEASVAQAQQWNYLYIVQAGSPDYQYYFINSVDYVSPSTVELDLELDVMQTYMVGRFSMLPCFVERTHVDDDLIGRHTVPEGLEMGPYLNYHQWDHEAIKDMAILVLSAVQLSTLNGVESAEQIIITKPKKYGGVFSGLTVYAYAEPGNLELHMRTLETFNKIDGIISIWMFPKKLVSIANPETGELTDWNFFYSSSGAPTEGQCAVVTGVVNDDQVMNISTSGWYTYRHDLFEGYTPKNNKLYTHPYNLLYCTNNAGETAEFRFEYFDTANPKFALFSAIGADATVKLCPEGYNGVSPTFINYDEGISLGAFPQCAWNSDSYKLWLAQNYNQMGHNLQTAGISGIAGLATMVAGVATANPMLAAGGIAGAYSGFNQIMGIMAQKEDAKAQPPQARGTFSTGVNVTAGRHTFSFYYKCIRMEYAQQIDEFFTMYGYRINRIMVPNPRVRKAFTFIKTVGCKITGMIPQEDLVHIQTIFDNGITFWVDPDRVGDYTQDNTL